MSDLDFFTQLISSPNDRAGFFGVATGIVTNNKDPKKLGRVKVKLPWLSDADETPWARVLTPMAGKERGMFFLPEVDDEVLVAFQHGRMDDPVILGALWNGKDTPPETNDNGKNDKRTIKSRSGHIIRLDDTESAEKIEILDKTGKNTIVIDTAKNAVLINADADIAITSANGKITLSAQTIELNAKADVKAEASSGLELKASGAMKLQGATIDLN
jgi:phage baseplate assembly protein V